MLAWEIEGLIMAGCDDLTHMKNSSANLIVYVLNSARVVCEDRYAHFFLQLKALTSFPDTPFSLKKSADLQDQCIRWTGKGMNTLLLMPFVNGVLKVEGSLQDQPDVWTCKLFVKDFICTSSVPAGFPASP